MAVILSFVQDLSMIFLHSLSLKFIFGSGEAKEPYKSLVSHHHHHHFFWHLSQILKTVIGRCVQAFIGQNKGQ